MRVRRKGQEPLPITCFHSHDDETQGELAMPDRFLWACKVRKTIRAENLPWLCQTSEAPEPGISAFSLWIRSVHQFHQLLNTLLRVNHIKNLILGQIHQSRIVLPVSLAIQCNTMHLLESLEYSVFEMHNCLSDSLKLFQGVSGIETNSKTGLGVGPFDVIVPFKKFPGRSDVLLPMTPKITKYW